MSVLCCYVPNFLVQLTRRTLPRLADRPVALLGPDERVWAVSAEAWQEGVRREMRPQQALTRCPDLYLKPVDMEQGQTEQQAFLDTLLTWGLPVEAQTWGAAYVDLHQVAVDRATVQPLCTDMGRRLRNTLGEQLQPALGWDSGKFTARAAASRTRPGRMRLVGKADEARFLSPLPITLLPLPPLALQQLAWLGICTLGQFAALPSVAVWQRFGQAGKLAQQWAKGRDNRPVMTTVRPAMAPTAVDFAPPTVYHGQALEAALAVLQPQLTVLAEQLTGCRRLHLNLLFDEGSERTVDCIFVEPVSSGRRLRATLEHRLRTLSWPAPLATLSLTITEIGELPAQQLTLFPEMSEAASPVAELVHRLNGRYGPLFFQGAVVEPGHVLPERRSLLQNMDYAPENR